MTVEEALVALLTLVAVALLFVGLAQALDTPRRRPLRPRPRGDADATRRRTSQDLALERHARGPRVPLPVPPSPEPQPIAPAPEERQEPSPRPVQMALLDASPAPSRLEVEAAAPAPAAEPEPGLEPPTASPPADSPLAGDCLRMYQEGEYAQLLEAAAPALRSDQAETASPGASCEQATLWSLVGLSRQALGDRGGARQAFEAGLASAAAGAEVGPPRVMELAIVVAQQLVAAAEVSTEGPADTAAGLAVARVLVTQAATAEPGDEALRDLAARAGEARWTMAERRAAALLERRDLDEAHRVIQDALGTPDLPAPRREALSDLLWTSVTGEVGRLAAQALEVTGEVGEALGWLDRAAEVVRRLPPGTLTSEREEDLQRRLWWGHTKLGVQRIEAGEPEAALPTLYRALGLPGLDAERQAQSRRALARALEAFAQRVQEDVQDRLARGDQPGAEARGQALCRAIDEAFEQGLGQEDLADANAKRQHVMALVAGVEGA